MGKERPQVIVVRQGGEGDVRNGLVRGVRALIHADLDPFHHRSAGGKPTREGLLGKMQQAAVAAVEGAVILQKAHHRRQVRQGIVRGLLPVRKDAPVLTLPRFLCTFFRFTCRL